MFKYTYKEVPLDSLVGLTMESVVRFPISDPDGSMHPREFEDDMGDAIAFTATDGSVFVMYHNQECCEDVSIEDICGDLDRLVGSPILGARVNTNEKDDSGEFYSQTWTFYNIYTAKGSVTIRWYGASNGYYSEEVTFAKQRGAAL